MPIDQDIIRKKTRRWRNLRAGPNHRGTVIRYACRLEWDLADTLLDSLSTINSGLDREQARNVLFGEGRALGSLDKMAVMACHLGLIRSRTKDDLLVFSEFRNNYAKKHDRKQVDNDHELFS